jgi:hypothetical protein
LEAEKRPVRGKQDSQKHRYLACRRPEFEKIREKAHKPQLDEVEKISSERLIISARKDKKGTDYNDKAEQVL